MATVRPTSRALLLVITFSATLLLWKGVPQCRGFTVPLVTHPLHSVSSTSVLNSEPQQPPNVPSPHQPPANNAFINDNEIPLGEPVRCTIKVLGVGGGGGNACNHMMETTKNSNIIHLVEFLSINTDAQALSGALGTPVLIGSVTRGLGAGGNPSVGAQAAMESTERLQAICEGTDLVFVCAGMGGGTGSGAAPVLAEVAQRCGCLVVGVVTKPFAFEGRLRYKQADEAIEKLSKHVDTLIVVSNDKLLEIVPNDTPIREAFLVADNILRQGVVGISEIILKAGLVNVDFADVQTVLKDAGPALMGIGTGVGPNRASEAALAALSSPLLDLPLQKAKRVVFNVVGGTSLGLREVNAASEIIYDNCDEDANIIFGALVDPDMGDQVSVTVLACDFESQASMSRANNRSINKQAPPLSASTTRNDEPSVLEGERRQKQGDVTPPPPPMRRTGFKRPPVSSRQPDVAPSKKDSESRLKKMFGAILGD